MEKLIKDNKSRTYVFIISMTVIATLAAVLLIYSIGTIIYLNEYVLVAAYPDESEARIEEVTATLDTCSIKYRVKPLPSDELGISVKRGEISKYNQAMMNLAAK